MNLLGSVGLVASIALATVFTIAGLAKLSNNSSTSVTLGEFGIPSRLTGVLSRALPLAELTVSVLLIGASTRIAGAVGAMILLVLFSVAIVLQLARGNTPACNCFGQLAAAPISARTLARNAVLAVLAGIALYAGFAHETPSAVAWVRQIYPRPSFAFVLSFASLTIAVATGFAFVSLLRTHGKVLLRVDALERRLGAAGIAEEDIEETPPALGHEPGVTAPAFSMSTTAGAASSLSDLLEPALPVMLIFTSTNCGACKTLLPRIVDWQRDHSHLLTIAVANAGETQASIDEANEFGLDRFMLDTDSAVYERYNASGTPSALLIAPDGTIASHVAPGIHWIEKLLERTVAEARENAAHVKVGTVAPAIVAHGISGESVSLAGFKEDIVLLFWNPDCGFCSSMRNDLLAWERNPAPGAPRLLIASTGDAARVKSEEFSSTVLLDPEFTIGDAFGAGGTPMAIHIDGEGRIASQLAAGSEAIFALVGGRSSGAPQSTASAARVQR